MAIPTDSADWAIELSVGLESPHIIVTTPLPLADDSAKAVSLSTSVRGDAVYPVVRGSESGGKSLP